jgi:Flp pilus assembly pilin Flp
MPIEEYGFFFIVPFCSIFLHYSLCSVLKPFPVGETVIKLVSVGLILGSISIVLLNLDKLYTSINFSILAVVISLVLWKHKNLLSDFYMTFLFILVPFTLANGALTGLFTDVNDAIVQYDNQHFIGRIGTIPYEDFGFAFSMLLLNLFIYEKLSPEISDLKRV